MTRPDLPDGLIRAMVQIGGLCAIATLIGLLISISSYGIWIISIAILSPLSFVYDFARSVLIITLPFFIGTIAIGLSASYLVDQQIKRSSQVTQQENFYVAALQVRLKEWQDIMQHLRRIEAILAQVQAGQRQTTNELENFRRIYESLEALRESSDSSFFEPEDRFQQPCRFLNPDASNWNYLRCSEQPQRTSCDECSSYRPS